MRSARAVMSSNPLPPWRQMATRRSVVEVPPYRIHTVEFGEGAHSLVLLHGLSGSARWWRYNVLGFARHFRVLVPDIVGFGRTRCRGPLPDMAGFAEVLAGWAERLELGAVDVVGHSMGGQIAMHLAGHFPERVRRLVLVDAAGIPRPLTPLGLARFAADVAPPSRWGDPRFVPVIVGDALLTGPRTIVRALVRILRDDVRALLPRITAPTLVLWGERDTVIPLEHARELRARIPGAQLVVLRGAAHNPMVDRPDDFNRVVTAFLHGEDVGE